MEAKLTIRIATATPKIEVANCHHNTQQIIEVIKKADAQQVQLLCLPESCIAGATCGYLFLQPTLVNAANAALNDLADASKDMDMAIVIGLHNIDTVIANGKIFKINPSSKVPIICENIRGCTFAIGPHSIDVPQVIVSSPLEHELVDDYIYRRRETAMTLSANCIYVQISAGLGESTTDRVFSGRNIIAYNGKILAESPPFADGWAMADVVWHPACHCGHEAESLCDGLHAKPSTTHTNEIWSTASTPKIAGQECWESLHARSDSVPHPFISLCSNPEDALQIQAVGLAKRISHTNGTAVIGISGGLDSCLALLVTVRAYQFLGKPVSQIIAVTMPCYGTTAHTKNNAHALCAALGIPCREIDITASIAQHLQDIGHPTEQFDVVFENAQARMRTMVLMNIANQVNGLVIGTGSLSELALGWATYNGDHMSMYAVNAGVPKTLVRYLVKHIAKTCAKEDMQKVLESILATKVSPELLPAQDGEITQITEELVGPYELHDFFIYHALVKRREPKEILTLAKNAFASKYSGQEILHWLRTFYKRFFSQQFKRNCLPDSPQVVPLSFSPRTGLQMPSDASAELWLKELE